ncbi:unnamed protein product [Rhizopus stolonifer]
MKRQKKKSKGLPNFYFFQFNQNMLLLMKVCGYIEAQQSGLPASHKIFDIFTRASGPLTKNHACYPYSIFTLNDFERGRRGSLEKREKHQDQQHHVMSLIKSTTDNGR